MRPAAFAVIGVALGCATPSFAATTQTAQTTALTCKAGANSQFDVGGPQWNGWSPGVTNARFQGSKAAGLTASSVPRLKLKWAFNLGSVGVARAQPVVVAGRVFTTAQNGTVYALDAGTGCAYWKFQAGIGIRSGVTFGNANGVPAVFVTGIRGTTFALDANLGRLIWKTKPVDEHAATIITATPTFYNGVIFQPVSSAEEALAAKPDYQCCTFRGSVVALDAATGKMIWQTFTIAQMAVPHKTPSGAQQYGPSGAAIWSSPTIDIQRGALYVATGDNYSDPPTNTSDAVLAFDMKSGKLLWSQQFTRNDTFNDSCASPMHANCPTTIGPDADFGQSPILVELGGGKRALVVAQKSGMAYAVDPDQRGKVLWQVQAGGGGPFGGSQWGSASDGNNMYVAISGQKVRAVRDSQSVRGFRLVLDPGQGGGLVALDLANGKIVWKTKAADGCAATSTDCSPAQSAAVTAIPGVVFSGSVDGHLRAYSTSNGEVIWDTNTARAFDAVNGGTARGGSIDAAGPTVVNGIVFANSGYGQWGGMPGNVLLAFSVNGQ